MNHCTCYDMAKPQKHHTRGKPPDTKDYVLHEMVRRGKSIQRTACWLLGRGGEGKGRQVGMTTDGHERPLGSDGHALR